MSMFLSRRRLIQGVSVLGFAAAAGLPRASRSADGAVLRSRMNADIAKIDPLDWASHAERDVGDTIFGRLISYKPSDKWEWQLELAEEIEQIDPTHIRFKLRPGSLFSNDYGEVTAEDVKFSFERVADPKMESGYKDDWGTLDHVEVTDKHNGVIVLKEAFMPLWSSTLPWASGSILSKKATEAAGGRITTDPVATSGPYYIKEWVPKQRLTLARNPGFTPYKPEFDEIVLLPIEDEKAAEIAYLAGELDYTKASPTSAAELRANLPEGSKLIERPTLDYIWLSINVEHPLYTDPRVREAIAKAINVQEVLDGAYFGAAGYATGVVGPGLPGHLDKAVPQRDVEGAKALLAEAGKGAGFKTTIYTLPRTDRVLASQIIQQNLAEIGIEAEIVQLESGEYWSLAEQKGKDLELTIMGYGGAPDPSWGTMWFTPEQVGVWNWERWNSPEFGELHKKALTELDPAKRAEMYVRMGELMDESHAYVWLANEPWVAIYRDTIMPASLPNGWVRYPLFTRV